MAEKLRRSPVQSRLETSTPGRKPLEPPTPHPQYRPPPRVLTYKLIAVARAFKAVIRRYYRSREHTGGPAVCSEVGTVSRPTPDWRGAENRARSWGSTRSFCGKSPCSGSPNPGAESRWNPRGVRWYSLTVNTSADRRPASRGHARVVLLLLLFYLVPLTLCPYACLAGDCGWMGGTAGTEAAGGHCCPGGLDDGASTEALPDGTRGAAQPGCQFCGVSLVAPVAAQSLAGPALLLRLNFEPDDFIPGNLATAPAASAEYPWSRPPESQRPSGFDAATRRHAGRAPPTS
jgi:hypothetical protein